MIVEAGDGPPLSTQDAMVLAEAQVDGIYRYILVTRTSSDSFHCHQRLVYSRGMQCATARSGRRI